MRIALAFNHPSPELEAIAIALSRLDEVIRISNGSPLSHTEVYDLAVCVGSVAVCPLAKKRILFVLGQVKNHPVGDWDGIVVSSSMAQDLAFKRFGHGFRSLVAPPPILGLEAGRRRLVNPENGMIHLSDGGFSFPDDVLVFRTWGNCQFDVKREFLYSNLDFNSKIRAGCVGYYPSDMEDGYDIQVRRHLALGGSVICRRDKLVLGDLTNRCFELGEKIPDKIEAVDCVGDLEEYVDKILVFVRRVL